MRIRLLLALALMATFAGHAQTNYDVIPLEGTPIKVTERKEDAPKLGVLASEPLAINAAATSGAGGNAAITETAGELSVSLTGGATYNVPIKVPPGINGVVPTISVSYNSQGGNGLAGFGWNISGISVISRIPSTKYHDNSIDPVDFDNQDRFALDGQRLLLQSGTYGANGAVYGTENFSNVKIVSNGVSSFGAAYGPLSFTVTYPDGSIATYGNSTDSRSRTDYAITKWQNPQGVAMDYTYTIADNSLSIATIKYGHRNTGAAPNTISFVYKARKRGEQSFVGGIDFRRKNILSEIKVLTGATGYRNYVLAHDFNTLGYERLISITEKSGDNTLSFTPINFTYNNTPATLTSGELTTDSQLSLSNIEQSNAEVVPLDFNADGKMDFMVYPKTRAERNKLWIFEDVVSGTANIGSEVSVSSIFETAFPVSYLNASNQLDKAQGFVLLTHTGTNEVRFKVNGQSTYAPAAQYYEKLWNAPSYQIRNNCNVAATTVRINQRYLSGDFNGDGLTDVIAVSSPYSFINCVKKIPTPTDPCGGGGPQPIMAGDPLLQEQQGALAPTDEGIQQPSASALIGDSCCECSNTSNTGSTVYFVDLDRRLATNFVRTSGNLGIALKPADQLYAVDVDGDGKTDFLHVSAGKVQAYTFSSTNTLLSLWTTTDTRIRTDYPLLLGDYNGDGKTDFMTPTALNSGTFALFRSTGGSFVKNEIAYPFTYRVPSTNSTQLTAYTLVPTDINGDGRTDMLEYKSVTQNDGLNGSQTVSMYFNTFSTLAAVTPTFTYSTATTRTGNLDHFPIPVFLSSKDRANNNLDFATISNNRVFYFTFGKDNREDMLLRNVSNNGVSQAISYKDLDRSPNVVGEDGIKVYTEKLGQVYPYIDIYNARGTKVVVAINRAVSGTTTIKQVFSYEGAVSHADGLGFMGFQGLARSEWNTGNSDRIWNITKHSIPLRGAVTSEYTIPYTVNFNAIPSDYITQTAYSYGYSLATNKVFKLWNASNVTQNRLQGGTAISKSFLYDSYNNPTKITTDFSGQGSSVVDLTYANSTGATYYIGRPTNKKETTTIGGNAFSTEEQYLYTGYLLTTKNTKGNGTPFDAETYLYDVFGNITRKTTTPNGTAARVVNFEYDSSGRYLTKSIDVEGLATTYLYNTARGMLTKETNPYGLATQYFYDGWDRLTKVTDYLNKNANTTYTEAGFVYTVTVTADNGGSKITVYDPLKRVTKVTEKDVLGQLVGKSFEFDKFDRIYRESEPYIGTSATQWNTTEYDFFGRVNKLTSYTGKVTTITYLNLSVAVNDGTKTVTTTKNVMGQITQVTDPGGTINYTYYGNGAMKTADYNNGVILTMEQDGWGRKTKTTDPAAGTYSYAYNAFGELTKETTPKGNTVYAYSTLGKLTTKTVSGDTNMVTTYTYDPTSKLLNSMALTTAGNNSTYVYAYDTYKRVSTVTETNPYAQFIKRYTYDAFGQVATEENESKLLSPNKTSIKKIKNTYQNGGLKTVQDNTTNEVLWNVSGLNARGQVTTSTMGNNLRKSYTYNSTGYLTESKSEKNVNTTAVELMKLTFNFNTQRGILNSRTNSLFTWTENFTYDNLDRLLAFNDNNGSKSHTYDTQGRITTNTNTGSYAYTGKSYQLASLTLNTPGQAFYGPTTRQDITYNSFKSPVEIVEAGKDRVSFDYNAFMGRANMFYGGLQTLKTDRRYRKHYSLDRSMEITYDKTAQKATFVTYIGGDGYSAPVIWRSEQTTTTVQDYYFLHRDYLGSILGITDRNGTFKEKRHFDAWGNLTKFSNDTGVTTPPSGAGGLFLDRGYTGHEHLLSVGLVHMNGRLYDPVLHRFLMPDNYVQDPYNTQNFNRYSYVLNNPLMYTDPSGEFFWFAVGIGALVGAISQAIKPGANFGSIMGGALIGAAAGMVGAGVGNVVAGGTFFGSQVATTLGFSSGFVSGAAGGFAGGFVGASGSAWLNGAGFGTGLGAGLKAGLIGGVTGGFVNGISSGIRALGDSRTFWSGEKWNELTIGNGNNINPFAETEEFFRNWDGEISMDIPYTEQAGELGCTYSCKLSVDKYFGMEGQERINSSWLSKTTSLKSLKLLSGNLENYYNASGYSTNPFTDGLSSEKALPWMVNQMKAGRITHVQWQNGAGGHASLVTKIQYLSDFSRSRVFIMDPNFVRPQIYNLSKTFNMFSIWKK